MSAVARHLGKFKSPRPSKLQQLSKQDATTAVLMAEVRRMKRQKQIDRIKRVLRWPAYVWRW